MTISEVKSLYKKNMLKPEFGTSQHRKSVACQICTSDHLYNCTETCTIYKEIC